MEVKLHVWDTWCFKVLSQSFFYNWRWHIVISLKKKKKEKKKNIDGCFHASGERMQKKNWLQDFPPSSFMIAVEY